MKPRNQTHLFWGVALFAILQVMDVPLTQVALSRGATELNPLMAALLSRYSYLYAEALKLFVVIALSATILTLSKHYPRLARMQLDVLITASAFLCLVSVVNILQA